MQSPTTVLLALFALGLALQPAADAQVLATEQGDRLFLADAFDLTETPLPRGPRMGSATLDFQPVGLVATTDGFLYGVENDLDQDPFPWTLHEILEGGETREVGILQIGALEQVWDFAAGPGGTFYVLTTAPHPLLPTFHPLIRQIDPRVAPQPVVVHETSLIEELDAIAPSPNGLWGVVGDRLVEVDLELGILIETGIVLEPGFRTLAAETDSGGALWLTQQEESMISPPLFRLARLDLVTGTLRENPLPLDGFPRVMSIARRCVQDATHRCLLGGRFRAEARWKDFDGNEGAGQVVPGGSADSALFWFFEAANWEVLVKLVDGCGANGHFWVFVAGTTDVEFELTVTDLVTGETFEASNPLGRASAAVTDTTAFATCGGNS